MITSGIEIGNAQQKEVFLYDGCPAGSEDWNWEEKTNNKNKWRLMVTYNVVRPSVTVFTPDIANGTAVIICPGGGFHFLAIDWEGTAVAKLLAKKGFTVFILKYRLVHVRNDNPFEGDSPENQKTWDDEALPIIPLAVDDARAAIAHVRRHAREYHIATDKIGIMGFSAGGRVAASAALEYKKEDRPDFVVAVYADMPESLQTSVPLVDAPPLFLACAQDDEFGFTSHAIGMYANWYSSKHSVEMYLFNKGGHGFGVGSSENTTHEWIDKLGAWLRLLGFMK